jgi:hypothetical protein
VLDKSWQLFFNEYTGDEENFRMAGYWFAGWLCARSLAINHLVFLCAADQTAAGASTSMHQNTHKFII